MELDLGNIVENIEKFDDELVIYALKRNNWEMDSPATVILDSEIDQLPEDFTKMSYFLEIGIAKEVLHVWSQWRDGQKPSNNEKFEAIVYYAENDSYIR